MPGCRNKNLCLGWHNTCLLSTTITKLLPLVPCFWTKVSFQIPQYSNWNWRHQFALQSLCHSEGQALELSLEMIYLARGLINLFSTISLLSHSTTACLVSALAVVMAPHGAPGAKRVSTDLQLEAKSEKRVLRIKHSQSSTSRAPVAEGTVEFPGVHRAQCSENSPNSQSARTDKKSSAPPVFPRSQIFLIVLCLLFHHSHAGRILMYLPVATRYT